LRFGETQYLGYNSSKARRVVMITQRIQARPKVNCK
jgi:hypothetical protein